MTDSDKDRPRDPSEPSIDAIGSGDQTAELGVSPVRVGEKIGPYLLIQQIGEGGMGMVYEAVQEQPIRRHVALKIVKPGLDSERVVARFEAERNALERMDHPYIAQVLDAGVANGRRPYFVMELVRGLSITEYCDAQRMGVRQRARLLVTVCPRCNMLIRKESFTEISSPAM